MKLSLKAIMKPKMDTGGCVGSSCPGCESGNCMSEGGMVAKKNDPMPMAGLPKTGSKPKSYAEGGEVMDSDGDMDGDMGEDDSAMMDSCASELLDGFEKKDKAQILEAIKAIVLSVR